ncbi:hypothetical protein [Acinetobacter sp. 'aerobic (ED)']|uniref:hypothetical protein n=1 Tax=Acinetobacter sp. 'aerobic (ED)' TaxID=174230 RepID=UPI00192C989A|nr:hypothetical protein [Acinetobacter sp. 'aerobic (ED)']
MNNYKIKVNDEAESKEAQELLFQLGYKWEYKNLGKKIFNEEPIGFLYAEEDGSILSGGPEKLDFFNSDENKELTLPQLRDLVVQRKSKVREYLDPNDNYKLCLINPSDATHWMIEVPKGAELYVYWPLNGDHNFQSGQSFYKDGIWNPCSFSVEEIKKGDAGAEILWFREPIQEQGLISGADAKLAWAKGDIVQLKPTPNVYSWRDITAKDTLSIFEDGDNLFRLKPRTIKLELEIPAPFEPKDDDRVWVLDVHRECGYGPLFFNSAEPKYTQFGAWRTEEEIKQVVAALRGD